MSSIEKPGIPANEPAPADQRPPRHKVLKGAHVAFNSEFSAVPCTIRNMSETGSRIIIEGGWFIPEQFMLHVDIDGYKVECKRVWQRGSECGARFIGEKIKTGRARQQVLTPEAEIEDLPPHRHELKKGNAGVPPVTPTKPVRPSGNFGHKTR
ncbi:MAG: hypothetical protein KUA43_07705 [Hoeflea sp.]|uniref:hypothetical protein n=1 Tax=Hoeflea sp. TaxID=1940281 RepID=UPI001D8F3968|nr:hypothetical protein [Hoeflea sp.]MBU4542302.1 hypothetical protein [Alphaproteobacteria bacterium]MBV1723313.1 hypothetical protein [Hoeflea sp.]MBV1760002.1 hypothetical protein [Hoeflea sp.]MBV1781831.1 hypothetical protein [Hoeflea sp.]